MVGLGAQEILLLGILFAVPAVIIVFMLIGRSRARDDVDPE
jgi:hypothetical protein